MGYCSIMWDCCSPQLGTNVISVSFSFTPEQNGVHPESLILIAIREMFHAHNQELMERPWMVGCSPRGADVQVQHYRSLESIWMHTKICKQIMNNCIWHMMYIFDHIHMPICVYFCMHFSQRCVYLCKDTRIFQETFFTFSYRFP